MSRKKKLLQKITRQYGSVPDFHYFHSDLEDTRSYFDFRRDRAPDAFYIDEITWRDLSMDDVYKRINNTLSTSGEQVLYYLMRHPAMTQEEHGRRKGLIALMESNEPLRLKVQMILARLGKRSSAKLTAAYHPPSHSPVILLLSLLAVALFLLSLALLPSWSGARALFVIVLMFNLLLHTLLLKRIEQDIDTVQYSVSMVDACRSIEKLNEDVLFENIPNFVEAGRKASVLRRFGTVSAASNNDLAQLLNAFLLIDIITYELTKNRLARYHNEIFLIHEGLGQIDAAISIASYRVSAGSYCVPLVHYGTQGTPFIKAKGMAHPLIAEPVENDVDTSRCILLTGSNASGKSTYLKCVVLNAILAQSISTALCREYEAAAFHIYTSMAIRDDVIGGDSYFVAEIKSLRRIMDALGRGERVLCAIDEVLRGTNTVERIAASSELLREIASQGALCMAATHDIELCVLLRDTYSLYHFEEQVEGAGVFFDYLLREGPSATRNAIKLLGILGFDQDVVNRAEQRAIGFLSRGQW